jgi:DNA adenine methylase
MIKEDNINLRQSPIKYIGKKSIDLEKYEVNKCKLYCEPFGGSFNTGFKLMQSGFKGELVYNDSDKHLFGFWQELKNNRECLWEEIRRLRDALGVASEDEKKNILSEYIMEDNKTKKAAGEFLFRASQTLDGVKIKSRLSDKLEFDLVIFEDMLHSEKLTMHNINYKEIIEKTDSAETFYLIDPPYLCKKVNRYYRNLTSEFGHVELFEELKKVKGRFLLTYNEHEEIRKLYRNYNIETVERKMGNIVYKELYITNY